MLVGWFTPTGAEMSDQDWQAGFAKSLGVFINGAAIATMDEHGERIVDDSFYVMFNADQSPLEFVLPEAKWGERWTVILDTSEPTDHLDEEDEDEEGSTLASGDRRTVNAWTLVLLRRLGPDPR